MFEEMERVRKERMEAEIEKLTYDKRLKEEEQLKKREMIKARKYVQSKAFYDANNISTNSIS